MSSPSATSEPFSTRSKPIDTQSDCSFPQHYRLLRSGDFRKAYREGMRVSGRYFRAFCLDRGDGSGPRIGLTVPRALGKAVVRNRIKRMMREAVRHEIRQLGASWDVVFNPRGSVSDAPLAELREEVSKVFRRCDAS